MGAPSALYLENLEFPVYDLYKELSFSSHPRAKAGHQGPAGSARAQPWLWKKNARIDHYTFLGNCPPTLPLP